MIIKNKRELATTELRGKVLDIIEAGIYRVLPSTIMRSTVKYDPARRILTVNKVKYDLSGGRVFVIGGGKASALMAQTLESILLPENIVDGIINCKSSDYKTNKIKIIKAGHPVPDEQGLRGVEQMLALKNLYSVNENDFIICLISGGGSALMPCPVEGVNLSDKQRITELLLGCGATIHEINSLRKHLSKTKGGGLGRYFAPATVVALILSDVIGNDLDVIASGQTCPDSSTFSIAYKVLEKYDLLSRAPRVVMDFLARGCRSETEETPKTLTNCHNHIIGDNILALEGMVKKAKTMGFNPYIITAEQKGDTTTVARLRAMEIISGRYDGYNVVLIGGETTPKIPANAGQGGRNQHYAAVSMLAMAECKGEWVMASVGTDGSDFLPDIAGAIVDNYSLAKARTERMDMTSYLDKYDSNMLLRKIGHSLIATGDTGTNVGDVMVYALEKRPSKQA